jgi:hypothetical protein
MGKTGDSQDDNNAPLLHEAPKMAATTLGSAAVGIVSRTFTHPIDTAKSRLQAQYTAATSGSSSQSANIPPRYRGTLDVLTRTFQTEGIAGLYRGFGAILVGGTPGTVLYLCTYEAAKAKLGQWKHDKILVDQSSSSSSEETTKTTEAGDFVVHFSSGLIAEAVACIIYVPVDVIKERLQVQHSSMGGGSGAYTGSYDALVKIAKHEGMCGVYKGYAATLASFGSFSAFYFMFYERLKAETRQSLFDPQQTEPPEIVQKKEIPFPWLVLCSCSAGGLASWLTSPLDMAKLRLQVQRGEQYQRIGTSNPPPSSLVSYRGVVDCLRTSYREGGLRALFRGAGARVYFFAPATTITMSCYETFYSFVDKQLSSE